MLYGTAAMCATTISVDMRHSFGSRSASPAQQRPHAAMRTHMHTQTFLPAHPRKDTSTKRTGRSVERRRADPEPAPKQTITVAISECRERSG